MKLRVHIHFLHLLHVIFICSKISDAHSITCRLVIDREQKINDWMQWSIHWIYIYICTWPEGSKSCKIVVCKVVRKKNVDAPTPTSYCGASHESKWCRCFPMAMEEVTLFAPYIDGTWIEWLSTTWRTFMPINY